MNFSPYHAFVPADAWFLLVGAERTFVLALIGGTLATCLGLLVGWARHASLLVRIVTTPIIDVLRSVPLLVALILVSTFVGLSGFDLDPLAIALFVLTLYGAAFGAEIARAGFTAVDVRLRRAARCLGMGRAQEFIHIQLPLAARLVFPAWIGLMLTLVKDSALVSTIGYVELLKSSQIVVNRTNQPFVTFALSGSLYFAICFPCAVYGRRFEARMKHDLAR